MTKGVSAPLRRSVSTRATLGITSPPFSTTTASPTRMSFRRISSSLWSVARDTTLPPSGTGSSTATGVSVPVRPTCTRISRTTEMASREGYLSASAQRTLRDVQPSRSWAASESTFTTRPSVS